MVKSKTNFYFNNFLNLSKVISKKEIIKTEIENKTDS